jgi:hypothetical protein
MSNYKIYATALIITGMVLFLAGCYKTTTLLVDNTPAITKTVSFSTDVLPLLTTNCAKSGCHNGSISPNLTAANAFNSIVNGNFANTTTPANSLVYLWLTGKESAIMPLGAPNNPSNINGFILAWISQGAKNN